MKDTSTIGMGFLEKLFVVLFPVVLGTIGWFLPRLIDLVKKVPLFTDSKVIELFDSFNPFWVSIVLMITGVIIGVLLSLTVYSEALKMSIRDTEILINKDDKENKITKSDVKEVFMEDHIVVITGKRGQELLREKTDIKKAKVREGFLYHQYPWSEQDPYADDYKLWTLEDCTVGENVNAILYERRKAIREGDKRKIKHLRMDLNELGFFVKDKGADQYIRNIHN